MKVSFGESTLEFLITFGWHIRLISRRCMQYDQVSLLESIAESEDNRSSMTAVNILEYYFDRNYDKQIILPEGIEERSSVTDENKQDTEVMHVFPNPASESVKINFNQESTGEINLIDVSGEIVITQTATKQAFIEVDVSSLSAGIYFVSFTDRDNTVLYKKLIIQ